MKNSTKYLLEYGSIVEKEISANLSKIWDFTDDDSPTSWTKAVNTILANTAKINGRSFFTASKLANCNNREWLFDFVWYENNDFGLNNVCLVAESEWKNPWGNEDYLYDIQYDFEKLILARSEHRLMIFESQTILECISYIDSLKKIVVNSKLTNTGDRYLFAVWNREINDFYCDLLIT